jgi:S1-C subfamily serine protease
MARPAVVLVCAISAILLASRAFAAGPFGTIHVGLWKGGAYTNDSTGAFMHCAAGSDYINGVGLILGQTADHSWLLGFTSASWDLTPGTTHPIDLLFDGQAQFRIFGNAVNPKLISAPFPEAAANRLRRSHLMVATGNTQTVQFNVSTVGTLLPIITNCVDKIKSGGLAAATDFSVSVPKPPVVTTAAKSTESEATPAASSKSEKLISINGTGFVISSNGHVLTNDHVISRCVDDVRGNLTGEPVKTLRVVSKDETNDLALLQATDTFKETARIRATPVHSGDPVIAIGFPLHGLLTSDFTVTTGIVNSLSGIFNDTRFLQISAPIQPGNSGGPLLDTSGNVVGVVAEKLNAVKFAKITGDFPQNINFAIKTGAVRDFLDNSVVPYHMDGPVSERKTADIASDARAYTMLISCSAKTEESEKK